VLLSLSFKIISPVLARFCWVRTVCVATLLATPMAWAVDPIVIGRSLVLSGPLKSYGEAKRDGGDAYVEKVNKSGGIAGKPIKLVTLDDEYQPPKLVANLKQLASEQQPIAFLGLFGLPNVSAALPLLLDLKIPAVGLTSGAVDVRTPHNAYAFPVRASFADEARKLVGHVKTVGLTRLAVIYSDNPFGESVKGTLVATLKKEGLEISEHKLDPAGKDAAAVVATVVAGKPQSVFLTMLSQPALPVLRELKKNHATSLVYTFSPVDTSLVLKELGAGAAGLSVTQIVPIPTSKRLSLTTEYMQALTELGRGTPSFYGLEAFVEAKVLVEGLRRAGGVSPNSLSLIKGLESMSDWDVGGFYVTYKPGNHAGASFVEIDVIDSNGVVRR
jgi:branched-chain amino acid transport system substrate-binding protein